MKSCCVCTILVAVPLLAPCLSQADPVTLGPFPDFKGVNIKWQEVEIDLSTFLGVNVGIPFDGSISIGVKDGRTFTVEIPVPVPIFAPTWITVESSNTAPFNPTTDDLTLTDAFVIDLNPDGAPEDMVFNGFDPFEPELVPASGEFFVGHSGTVYNAHINVEVPVAELPEILPGFDLSAFSEADPDSIVYVSQTTMPAWDAIVPDFAPVQLSGGGDLYYQDFDEAFDADPAAIYTLLPPGWAVNNIGATKTITTDIFPPPELPPGQATVGANGPFNAGREGDPDRTLAVGNQSSSEQNEIVFTAEVTGDTDVELVRVAANIEAWYGIPGADAPGEAAFDVYLAVDSDGTGFVDVLALGTYTTGPNLFPGEVDGNAEGRIDFDTGTIAVAIPAGSLVQLSFDAQGQGDTSGYVFGVDEVIFQIVALGDVNLDGQINGLDVEPFVATLLGGLHDAAADMNGDGVVNGLDVDPFVAAVIGGTQPVPEPSTLLLCIIALGVVGGWRIRSPKCSRIYARNEKLRWPRAGCRL